MVKFTFLYSRILSMKQKKTFEHSVETMHKTLEDCSQKEAKSSQGDFFDEPCSKSEGNNSNFSGSPHTRKIRKSISLGSGLGREGRDSTESDSENEKRENERRVNYHETIALVGVEQLANGPANRQKDLAFELTNDESVFSIGDTPQLSKHDDNISYSQFSPYLMVKAKSLNNICSPPQILASHSRSAEDLTALDVNKTEMDSSVPNKEENIDVNDRHFHGEFLSYRFENMPSIDYRMKRIEDWVSDLQHFTPLEETNDELSNSDNNQILEGNNLVDGAISSKINDNLNPGVEVAKRYISSLSPSATTAHLANHGLVIVPFLSAFVSLRTLNISGNFIVKITAGALPRGLHVLNLSKNSISVVEGLRELTRLRVLDLSYNRIVKIGHGLASCSSLKELYLSGNKISEIEGLHRLLKLNVLDLCFNKISTTKSLGQLAANYNSLQAIGLEGNPAQKHIGDENIKKHLQGLLPQLSYYNRHSIKTKAMIDGSDRLARCTTSNRSLRSDHRGSRNKSGSSSRNHPVLPKTSKSKGVRLPPTGNKALAPHRNPCYDFGTKILGFGPDSLMKKSRSEGTLGGL